MQIVAMRFSKLLLCDTVVVFHDVVSSFCCSYLRGLSLFKCAFCLARVLAFVSLSKKGNANLYHI